MTEGAEVMFWDKLLQIRAAATRNRKGNVSTAQNIWQNMLLCVLSYNVFTIIPLRAGFSFRRLTLQLVNHHH